MSAMLSIALLALSSGQGAPGDLAAQIEAAAGLGEFGQALAVAHGIKSDPERFAVEADLLYRARSYTAALGRAEEAYQGGIQTPLLLSRGLSACLWSGDLEAGEMFSAALGLAVDGLPARDQPAWKVHAAELDDQLKARHAGAEQLALHVNRGRWVSGGLLGLAAACMAALLRRKS